MTEGSDGTLAMPREDARPVPFPTWREGRPEAHPSPY